MHRSPHHGCCDVLKVSLALHWLLLSTPVRCMYLETQWRCALSGCCMLHYQSLWRSSVRHRWLNSPPHTSVPVHNSLHAIVGVFDSRSLDRI